MTAPPARLRLSWPFPCTAIIIIEDDTQEDTISNQERAAKRRRRAEQAQHAPELGGEDE